MNLFQTGAFTLASGKKAKYKFEFDAATPEDWETFAAMIADLVPFGKVEGVPRGGVPLAAALRKYANPDVDRLLIVDDVGTTGGSLERHRAGRKAIGMVVFRRGPLPPWVGWLSDWANPYVPTLSSG